MKKWSDEWFKKLALGIFNYHYKQLEEEKIQGTNSYWKSFLLFNEVM